MGEIVVRKMEEGPVRLNVKLEGGKVWAAGNSKAAFQVWIGWRAGKGEK